MSDPVPDTEFTHNFVSYRAQAELEPVLVTSQGKITGYFISPEDYEEFERLRESRQRVASPDMPEGTIWRRNSQENKRHPGLGSLPGMLPDELKPQLVVSGHRLARVIAFYLPQYHSIPENNAWWGPGFTEWTNVVKARPLFRGHHQPNLPADLGFYDLRLSEVREQQADLARSSGIEGFCYWHYWFGHGRRILERPFEEVLRSGRPDFPFCLAWANQSWSGIWHGDPGRVLIEQSYPGPQDSEDHFRLVEQAFRDPRYMTVEGKPIFAVYNPLDLPDASAFVAQWRALARQAGFPDLYLVAMCNQQAPAVLAPFDAVITFGPGDFMEQRSTAAKAWARLRRREFFPALERIFGSGFLKPYRFRYEDAVRLGFSHLPADPRYLPTIWPNWDNTPRSGSRGVVFEESTPDLFGRFLSQAIEFIREKPPAEKIIFLKAWNEWAEGNYVEPDQRHGQSYLDALRSVLLNQEHSAGLTPENHSDI